MATKKQTMTALNSPTNQQQQTRITTAYGTRRAANRFFKNGHPSGLQNKWSRMMYGISDHNMTAQEIQIYESNET